MSLFSKSRTRIRGLTLLEDALERVDSGQILRFDNGVQSPNDSAVEVSPEFVPAARWQIQCGRVSHVDQALVSDPHPIQTARSCEMKAEAQFNHSANDKRHRDIRRPASRCFLGELEST